MPVKGTAAKKASKPAKAPESPRPTGRPSAYSPGLEQEIFRRMAEGETLRAMCQEPGMPASSTVKLWAINDIPTGFSARYARAREFQADALAEEALELGDRGNAADAAIIRIRVDTRKWLASKINPAKFGDLTKLADPDGKPLKFSFALDNANGAGRENA